MPSDFHLRVIECCVFRAHLRRVDDIRRTTPLTALEQDTVSAVRIAEGSAQQAQSLARRILDSLDDAKAEDVVAIDLEGKTAMADLMVIATGRSVTHVNAIADRVIRSCKTNGVSTRIEGMPQCDWVLLDAGDVIVHVFRPEVRQFYNLERLWGVDRPGERLTG